LIIALRGGLPSDMTCDFCGKTTEELWPEEAGAWVCIECLYFDCKSEK